MKSKRVSSVKLAQSAIVVNACGEAVELSDDKLVSEIVRLSANNGPHSFGGALLLGAYSRQACDRGLKAQLPAGVQKYYCPA